MVTTLSNGVKCYLLLLLQCPDVRGTQKEFSCNVLKEGVEWGPAGKLMLKTSGTQAPPGNGIQTVPLTLLMLGNIYLAEPNKQCKEFHLSYWHSRGP